MATPRSPAFEELTKLASEFVTRQKGLWDHQAWMDFLSSLQGKGFHISEDMQSSLGALLEAMKQFYSAAASTASVENAMKSVVNDSVAFVKQHKGVWGHTEWEDFVKTMQRNTLTLSEGTSTYVGGILESMKVFYSLSPVAVGQKAAAEGLPRPSSPRSEVPAGRPEPQVGRAEPQAGRAAPPGPRPAQSGKEAAATKPQTRAAKEPDRGKVAAAPAPTGPRGGAAKGSQGVVAKPAPAAKAPQKRDDLTVIGGIGPALAKKLNGAGIFSFAQLAALSDEDVAHLEKNIIRLSGRIKRDDWVGQAKKLT